MVASTILFAVLAALPSLVTAAEPPHGARAVGTPAFHAYTKHNRGAPVERGVATRSRNRRGQCRVRPQAQAPIPEPASDSTTQPGEPAEPAPSTGNNTDASEPPAETQTSTDTTTDAAAQPSAEPTTTDPVAEPEQTPAADSTNDESTPTADAPEAATTTNALDNMSNALANPNSNGDLLYASGPCGDSQADANSPNGQEWWLNCGVDNSGWNPPHITLDQLKYVDLSADGIYAPCAPYFDKFYQYAAAHNLPPILIAAIAMQESTCNPSITGGAGEAGMMQLVGDNCIGAPNGDCYDLDFNINGGAKYLRQQIDGQGGNFLLGMGTYNGWYPGITTGDVAKIAEQNCFAQPNLDYMDQLLNGWLQGKTGYERGTYRNRDKCGQ